jgi:7,8-didemethyl-8-hydroxy-5-deazariboflavin synthase CofG subunit
LIGIGETRDERLDALFAIRDADRRGGGHVQEVLVQNFRAKIGTRMASAPEPEFEELLWTAACARLIFGPSGVIQVPPNLTPEPDDVGGGGVGGKARNWRRLLRAGVSDWGGISPGVTPDHVSPEAPWPELDALAAASLAEGYSLVPRLAAQPRYVVESTSASTSASTHSAASGSFVKGGCDAWMDPAVAPHVRVLSDSEGFGPRARVVPGERRSRGGGSRS